jgi:acid phosphatase type 7
MLVALAAAHDARAVATLTRYPYPQSLGRDRVVLMWRTATPVLQSVDYAPDGSYQASASDVVPTTRHELLLTGLQPGVRYTYRIREGASIVLAEPNTYWFRTDAGRTDTNFSFFVAGDIGEPPPDGFQGFTQARIRGMAPTADFGLLTGDIVYPDGKSSDYDDYLMTPWRNLICNTPVWPVPGNHDWHVDPDSNFAREWALPNNEHYYSFDYGTAHFVGLDTEDGALYDRVNQLAWLRADLTAARGHYQWTFVFYHHPLITCTYKGNEEALANDLLPIFDEFQVDICFTGHAHTYERLYPLRNRLPVAQAQNPLYTDPPGTVYVVSGCAGKLHTGEPTTLCGPTAAFQDETPGFVQVLVYGKTLYLVMVDSMTGQIHDWMQITKTTLPTDVTRVPARAALHQNVPNPFNPTTEISFELAAPARVTLRVVRPDGSLVTELARRDFAAGPHTVRWDGRDRTGARSPSGTYICQMENDGDKTAVKMMLVR